MDALNDTRSSVAVAIETSWKTYQVLNEWIRLADTKASVVLATSGVIATAGSATLPLAKASLLAHPLSLWMGAAGLVGVGISAICSVACLIPSVSCIDSQSLIFFGTIKNNYESATEYEKAATETFRDEVRTMTQISHQVWVNSCIAARKYAAAKWAIEAMAFAIVLLVLSAVFGLF